MGVLSSLNSFVFAFLLLKYKLNYLNFYYNNLFFIYKSYIIDLENWEFYLNIYFFIKISTNILKFLVKTIVYIYIMLYNSKSKI